MEAVPAPGVSIIGKGGGGSSNTIQKADPWEGVQAGLREMYGNAGNWFNGNNPQYYPNQTYAGLNPNQNIALDRGWSAAHSNLDLNTQNQAVNANIARGGQLGANPFLNSMFNAGTDAITRQFSNATAPTISSQFSAAGRYGSGAHQAAMGQAEQALGNQLGNFGSNLYGNAYNSDLNRQQEAIARAPMLGQTRYGDVAQMMGIGQTQQQNSQQFLNSDINRWDFNQNQPLNKLNAYGQLLAGGNVYGGHTTQQSMGGGNPFMQAMGTGLMANSLYGAGNQSGLWDSIGGLFGGAGGLGLTGGIGIGADAAATYGMASAAGIGGGLGSSMLDMLAMAAL